MFKINFQEQYPNCVIWILFTSTLILFLIGLFTYFTFILSSESLNTMYNYWPMIDAGTRIFLHVFASVIYRLCRRSHNKRVLLVLHVIIGLLAFLGGSIVNEHEYYKGQSFYGSAFIEKCNFYKKLINDPFLSLFSAFMELIYVKFALFIKFIINILYFTDYCGDLYILLFSIERKLEAKSSRRFPHTFWHIFPIIIYNRFCHVNSLQKWFLPC